MTGDRAPHTQAKDDSPIFVWDSVASLISGVIARVKKRDQGKAYPSRGPLRTSAHLLIETVKSGDQLPHGK